MTYEFGMFAKCERIDTYDVWDIHLLIAEINKTKPILLRWWFLVCGRLLRAMRQSCTVIN